MKMNVFILTEVGDKIGFGHLSRCISIYQSFQKRKIIPHIVLNIKGNYDLNLNQKYIDFDWINENNRLFKIINNSDVVIIDSYLAPISLYQKISSSVKIKAYIDDYQRLDYPEGIIINPSIFAEKLKYPKKKNTDYLLGSKYIPLRREFWYVPKRIIGNHIKQILITFGGEDIKNMTPKILNSIIKLKTDIKIVVIIGKGFNHNDQIKKLENNRIKLIHDSSSEVIKSNMFESDLAISAGGQTLYELARCGIPTIAISTARNQENNIKGWLKAGFIEYAGWWEDRNLLINISNKIDILKDLKEREKRSAIAKRLIDGRGAERIVSLIKKLSNIK